MMPLTPDERRALIEDYASGYDDVIAALAGIADDEWDAREAPGEWSPRAIVHHLADSEMDGAGRLKMLLAERDPVLTGWDQERWTALLFSADRPLAPSLAAFKAARDATVPLLRLMTADHWLGAGRHTEFGPMSADDWLAFYGVHAQDHADQIRRARIAAGARRASH